MATTTNYSWTTPDDTALVKDGAAAIRSLGTAIDTTTKNLNPSTTAGDIEYRSSTTNVNTRLAIGTAGQVLTVNSGATAPQWATPATPSLTSASAAVATSQNTTSTSYTDLTTSGPAVTVTTGTKALVIVGAFTGPQVAGASGYMSFAVSGATTISASDDYAFVNRGSGSNDDNRGCFATRLTTLTAGSNTFTAKYRVSNNNADFGSRSIIVIDLGS
jgi:hypothetical protein